MHGDDLFNGTVRQAAASAERSSTCGWSAGKHGFKIQADRDDPPGRGAAGSTWMGRRHDYGFYSNVNPEVLTHVVAGQERRIGELSRRETLPFNGYADEVAQLYAGMDLEANNDGHVGGATGSGSARSSPQAVVHVQALAPLALLIWTVCRTIDRQPDEAITARTGKTAVLLVLSLVCTPANTDLRTQAGVEMAPAAWDVRLPVREPALLDLLCPGLRAGHGAAPSGHFREAVCAGRLCGGACCCSPWLVTATWWTTPRQELEAAAPAGIPGRSAGRDTLQLAGQSDACTSTSTAPFWRSC